MFLVGINCQCLRGKLDHIRAICAEYEPAVFACQETKINKNVTDGELSVGGYILYRKDRTASGGGVALYISQRYHPRPLKNIQIANGLEIVATELSCGRTRLVVASVYRSHRLHTIDQFYSDLQDFVDQLGMDRAHLCIMGDVNIDFLTNPCRAKVLDFCTLTNQSQLIDSVTHNRTCIDHIYVPVDLATVTWGLGAPVEKLHQLTWVHLPLQSPPKRPTKKLWAFSRADWSCFKRILSEANLSDTVLFSSVDEAASKIQESVLLAARTAIPLKTSTNKFVEPWLPKHVTQLKRRRNIAHKQLKMAPNDARLKSKVKKLEKRFRAARKQSLSEYFRNLIGQADNLRSFWQGVKIITSGPKQITPTLQLPNGQTIRDNSAKANALADQFDTHWNRGAGTMPNVMPPGEIDPEWACSSEFILEEINRMGNHKSPGPDGIYPTMIKEGAAFLSPALALLVNRILSEGHWPDIWKDAVVCAIAKVRNTDLVTNFRPITLLDIMSKPAERHLYNLLFPYFEPLLSNSQFGFLKGRSTVDALFYFEYNVLMGFEKCVSKHRATKVTGVFFDVSKAFDSCIHGRMLTCFQTKYGVPDYLICVL